MLSFGKASNYESNCLISLPELKDVSGISFSVIFQSSSMFSRTGRRKSRTKYIALISVPFRYQGYDTGRSVGDVELNYPLTIMDGDIVKVCGII